MQHEPNSAAWAAHHTMFIAPVDRVVLSYAHTGGDLRCNIYPAPNLSWRIPLLGKIMLKWMDLSILLLLLLWCGLGIWFLEPVENANKPTTPEQQKRCHIIAMGIYVFDFILTVACYQWVPYYGIISLLSLAAVVIMLAIGTLVERRRKRNKGALRNDINHNVKSSNLFDH